MADYLSNVTADYTATEFAIAPQHLMSEIGGIGHQILFDGNDDNDIAISFDDSPVFIVPLSWRGLSESDAGDIVDFYYDSAKGNGKVRTFYWQHPTDGHTYTVRFEADISRSIGPLTVHSIRTVRFRVLGNKP